MPRYFFDVRDGKGLHRDEFGDDFTSLTEAITQVEAILGSTFRDEVLDGEHHKVACEVRDVEGIVIYRAELTYRGERL
jgi:hypothetical protein